MNKVRALKAAIDLANTSISASENLMPPCETSAENLADFIETLAKRLEAMSEID